MCVSFGGIHEARGSTEYLAMIVVFVCCLGRSTFLAKARNSGMRDADRDKLGLHTFKFIEWMLLNCKDSNLGDGMRNRHGKINKRGKAYDKKEREREIQ